MSAFRDISNETFGRLTAAWPVGRKQYAGGGTQIMWLVFCGCGNRLVIPRCSFGIQISCGCAKLEALRSPSRKRGTHGMAGTGAHVSWLEMRRRCLNPRTREYPNYGGRGITICARWATFQKFFLDMGPRPQGKSLDRVNNNGNYEPSNCKWSTPSEQALNRRPKRKHVCWRPRPLTILDIRSWAA
jgi:hypothetical protein